MEFSAVQRVGIQPPQALVQPSKNQRSRARSGRLQCRVGRARSVGYRIPIAQTNCYTALYHAWVRSRTEAGRTAGEPASGERCVRPRRCAFTTRNGALGWQRGAFRVRAAAPAFALIIVVWRAARYATALLVRTRRDRCSRLGPPNAMAG